MYPFFFCRVIGIRVGYSLLVVVSGATITVLRKGFISSGEMMITGLVFLISEPIAGSSEAK